MSNFTDFAAMLAAQADTFAVTFGKRSGATKSFAPKVGEYPPAVLMNIFKYGIQRRFNDAVGGSDMDVDAKWNAAKDMDARFQAGDIGRRAATSADPVADRMARIFRNVWKDALPDGEWEAEWKDADDLDDRLDEKMNEQSAEFLAQLREDAEGEIAAERAAKANRSNIKTKLTIV